jgi:hypothetical protein
MFNKPLSYRITSLLIIVMICEYGDLKNERYGEFAFKLIFIPLFIEGLASYSKYQSDLH